MNLSEPILRVAPRPGDINSNGHIFGGWIMSQMDIAGGIVAIEMSQGACATVAVERMEFIAPVLLRDLVSIYGTIERRGRTSIAIRLDVVAQRNRGSETVKVTTGVFTFVAIDANGRPRALPPLDEMSPIGQTDLT